MRVSYTLSFADAPLPIATEARREEMIAWITHGRRGGPPTLSIPRRQTSTLLYSEIKIDVTFILAPACKEDRPFERSCANRICIMRNSCTGKRARRTRESAGTSSDCLGIRNGDVVVCIRRSRTARKRSEESISVCGSEDRRTAQWERRGDREVNRGRRDKCSSTDVGATARPCDFESQERWRG